MQSLTQLCFFMNCKELMHILVDSQLKIWTFHCDITSKEFQRNLKIEVKFFITLNILFMLIISNLCLIICYSFTQWLKKFLLVLKIQINFYAFDSLHAFQIK